MTFKEKDFQTNYNKWCYHLHKSTDAYELKISLTGSWNYGLIKEHQVQNLLTVRNSMFVYKIPDVGISPKPFDSVSLYKEPAWVVIMFYASTKQKTFYMIDINVFVEERDSSERKSLTQERAAEIGATCYLK